MIDTSRRIGDCACCGAVDLEVADYVGNAILAAIEKLEKPK